MPLVEISTLQASVQRNISLYSWNHLCYVSQAQYRPRARWNLILFTRNTTAVTVPGKIDP